MKVDHDRLIRAKLDSRASAGPARKPPMFSVKDFVAAGGCMHRLRTRVEVGEEGKPWTARYHARDLPCVGKLHKGGDHLSTTVDGRSVLVHVTKGGVRWW